MHITFNLLFLFNIICNVIKKQIKHPKLYFDYKIIESQVQLYYYSNLLDSNGKRLSKFDILKVSFFSDKEMMDLNKKEYNNLTLYIKRQEKVMNSYYNRGLFSKYKIIKESLSLMYNFKKEFDDLFINSNIKI